MFKLLHNVQNESTLQSLTSKKLYIIIEYDYVLFYILSYGSVNIRIEHYKFVIRYTECYQTVGYISLIKF